MKLQIVFEVGEVPDEIIGIAPYRDKIVLATRRRLIVMEHDEKLGFKLVDLAKLHGDEFDL